MSYKLIIGKEIILIVSDWNEIASMTNIWQ